MFTRTLLAGLAALALVTGASAAGYDYGGSSGGSGGYSSGNAMAPAPAPAKKKLLTDTRGFTLYIYDKDAKGVSNCYGSCATNWPPYLAGAGAKARGAYSLVKRKDGKVQWAYGGHPLYRWIGDHKPGDAGGNGIGGIWHDIRIAG